MNLFVRKVARASGSFSLFMLLLVFGCAPQGTISTPSPWIDPIERVTQPVDKPLPYEVWPPKAVWVVREVYNSSEQIAELMENCRYAGFNTVLFQVRGNGTAFYRSSIEPFAYEYKGDPGFDPLTVACREAHKRGLALHAWVNVMPAWKGDRGPTDPRQLYVAHPEWFLIDQYNQHQPLGWYVSLNPCIPEVREYLANVMEEIVRYYPIDGLHLDYIRIPTDESPKTSDYPRDHRTVTYYKYRTGKTPQQDKAAWSKWRRDQVTQLVRDIRKATQDVRPSLKLTAACGANIEQYRKEYFQDGPEWLRGNLVDAVFVMNYSKDTKTFRLRQEAWQRAATGRRIVPGIGAYLHKSDQVTVEQMRLAKQWRGGVGLFSASVLLSNDSRSRQRLAAIRPMLMGM